jgi:hypothetical protein
MTARGALGFILGAGLGFWSFVCLVLWMVCR